MLVIDGVTSLPVIRCYFFLKYNSSAFQVTR